MNLNLRRIANYANCEIEIDNTVHDLGLLDRKQAIELLKEINQAADKLEWFLNVTHTPGDAE